MTSKDFNDLSIDKRADIVWAKGKFLENWFSYGKFKIALYFLEEYYVEVYYSLADNSITEIKAWTQMPMVGRPIDGVLLN